MPTTATATATTSAFSFRRTDFSLVAIARVPLQLLSIAVLLTGGAAAAAAAAAVRSPSVAGYYTGFGVTSSRDFQQHEELQRPPPLADSSPSVPLRRRYPWGITALLARGGDSDDVGGAGSPPPGKKKKKKRRKRRHPATSTTRAASTTNASSARRGRPATANERLTSGSGERRRKVIKKKRRAVVSAAKLSSPPAATAGPGPKRRRHRHRHRHDTSERQQQHRTEPRHPRRRHRQRKTSTSGRGSLGGEAASSAKLVPPPESSTMSQVCVSATTKERRRKTKKRRRTPRIEDGEDRVAVSVARTAAAETAHRQLSDAVSSIPGRKESSTVGTQVVRKKRKRRKRPQHAEGVERDTRPASSATSSAIIREDLKREGERSSAGIEKKASKRSEGKELMSSAVPYPERRRKKRKVKRRREKLAGVSADASTIMKENAAPTTKGASERSAIQVSEALTVERQGQDEEVGQRDTLINIAKVKQGETCVPASSTREDISEEESQVLQEPSAHEDSTEHEQVSLESKEVAVLNDVTENVKILGAESIYEDTSMEPAIEFNMSDAESIYEDTAAEPALERVPFEEQIEAISRETFLNESNPNMNVTPFADTNISATIDEDAVGASHLLDSLSQNDVSVVPDVQGDLRNDVEEPSDGVSSAQVRDEQASPLRTLESVESEASGSASISHSTDIQVLEQTVDTVTTSSVVHIETFVESTVKEERSTSVIEVNKEDLHPMEDREGDDEKDKNHSKEPDGDEENGDFAIPQKNAESAQQEENLNDNAQEDTASLNEKKSNEDITVSIDNSENEDEKFSSGGETDSEEVRAINADLKRSDEEPDLSEKYAVLNQDASDQSEKTKSGCDEEDIESDTEESQDDDAESDDGTNALLVTEPLRATESTENLGDATLSAPLKDESYDLKGSADAASSEAPPETTSHGSNPASSLAGGQQDLRFTSDDDLANTDDDDDITVSVVTWNLAEESPSEQEATFIRRFRRSGDDRRKGSDIVLISGQGKLGVSFCCANIYRGVLFLCLMLSFFRMRKHQAPPE